MRLSFLSRFCLVGLLALGLPALPVLAQVPVESPADTLNSLLDAVAPTDLVADAKTARMLDMRQPLSFFKSTRLVSFQTVETVQRGVLDSRVAHRFGNAATAGTTYHTLFGLDQAADIWLGLDYGITDRLQVGIARVKGAGQLHELWTFSGKMRLPGDAIGNLPVRFAIAANATFSTQTANPFAQAGDSTGATRPLNEGAFGRRGSYFVQLLAAAAPKGRFVFQVAPAWVYRNYVDYNDANGLLFLPVSGRFKVTRRFSLSAEYSPLLASSGSNYRGNGVFWRGKGGSWYAPLNLGLELETGGHVFQISLSNSAGLLENDLLPYNANNWFDGGFRMGFAIMRGFQVRK